MSVLFNIQKDLLIHRDDVKLGGKVGEGNYGEVWKASWRKVNVAVKKLLVQNATPEAIHMLEKEITTAARLRHPHVVQVYGACVYSPTEIWLVMEYADGGSLFSKLADRSVTISWSTRMRWAIEATTAVAFLHSSKLLHRDIKSPNFLLIKNEIKITDFGMSTAAASITSSTSSLKKSSPRENVGSVRWMAPETTAASPLFSEKSDVFGLGMVLWELATREIPFSHVSQEAQVIVLIKYEMVRPEIPPECPKTLAEVIKRCWEDSPKHRPTAEEVLLMIESEGDGVSDGFTKALQLSPFAPKPSTKRYFDINRGELLAVVPRGRIKVLTTPPPFPQKGVSPPFPLPPAVEIVSLLPPPHDGRENKHMLVSERYDERLFSRVAEYFHRFYVPRNSQTEVTLEKVDVIFNSALEEQFRKEDALLETQCKGFAEFADPSLSQDQQRYLSHLSTSQNLVPGFHSNPISAWHGSQQKSLDSICWYGLLSLSKNDPGYYGKGIYFTQEPKYGEFYAEMMKEKANGSFSLLLSWVLIGRPHPVTKVQIASPLKPGYTSHFSLVKLKRASESLCESPVDFKSVDGLLSYFPISGQEEVEGDEIIVFKSAQVLPRFIVHYSVTSQPAKPQTSPPTNSSIPSHILPSLQIPTQHFKKEFKKSYTTPEFTTSTKNPSSLAPGPLKPLHSPINAPNNPFGPSPPLQPSSSPPPPPAAEPTPPPLSSESNPQASSLTSSPPANPPIPVGAFAIYKIFYEKYKNNKLINGDKQIDNLLTPPGEDVKVWITINTINQFNSMNLIQHLVVDCCTESSCPQMTAGPKVSYFWAQDKHDKPISLPAPLYIKNLRAWILTHFENPKIFPSTLEGAFGESFSITIKKIWSRMFRVYAHIYHSHWAKLTARGAEEFQFSLKYLSHFSKEFKLLKASELEPMKEVLDKWK